MIIIHRLTLIAYYKVQHMGEPRSNGYSLLPGGDKGHTRYFWENFIFKLRTLKFSPNVDVKSFTNLRLLILYFTIIIYISH